MGSGKSTLGKKLAERLDRPFVDTDEEVEKMLGMPAREVFETMGESAFREAEQDALSDALRPNDPIVLATGGGTPCAEGPWSGCAGGLSWWHCNRPWTCSWSA